MILQSSEAEWSAARLGHVTASRISDIVAKTKTGWGASRTNYAAELIVERLTGAASDRYINGPMQHGIDTEPHARAAYEFLTDVDVGPAAFVRHPAIEWAGASPDGFVNSDGLVEFKCPNTATHIDTLLNREPASRYVMQMQWQMAVTDRAWCDFVSFDPRLPEHLRFFMRRIERDDAMIATLEREVGVFLAEIDHTLKRLEGTQTEPAADQPTK